ncbi:hypothetical protein [Thalassorhabdomicrobium marinisediminis]|uniref:hypothetical protein n=1 Tax=Thalassorhabdomicrobium marinisediminis TaxID=2170577 RepID=UPI0024905ABE|nr:hypothetical protein [Thalassorhabdomicrobium marinisediminis]
MTLLKKTLIATTATFIASTGAVWAEAHQLDVNAARLDTTLDTNGDGEVTDNEIIEGNVAFFDTNGNGVVDANERGVAKELLMTSNSTIDLGMMQAAGDAGLMIDFDVNAARLDATLDTNGDGEVSDDEIIEGNMALFDTDNNGMVDADERGRAEEALRTGSFAEVDAVRTGGSNGLPMIDVRAARLDMTLDTNGDGEVSDSEIIEGNVAVFDMNGDGVLDAEERGIAEQKVRSNS